MVVRQIVVFEDQNGDLDFRLVRAALPAGSKPLVIVKGAFSLDDIVEGEENGKQEIIDYATEQSGFPLRAS